MSRCTSRRAKWWPLLGASGSGKSTPLRYVAGFRDRRTLARSWSMAGRSRRRGRLAGNVRKVCAEIGFVFRAVHLVGRLPVITNVLCRHADPHPGLGAACYRLFKADEVAKPVLDAPCPVGTDDYCVSACLHAFHGGQQQRAAIATDAGAETRRSDDPADEPAVASLWTRNRRAARWRSLSQINRTTQGAPW